MIVIDKFRLLFNFIYSKIVILNLFDTKSLNIETIRREIYSTRLFLILLSISVIIITFYTALSIHVETKTIQMPTQIEYEKLSEIYSDSLHCTCTQISILYNEFTHVTPSFHQVCSSNFVSQSWIDFIFGSNTTFVWLVDVRTSISAMWQIIAALCQYANSTLIDTFDDFYNTPLISPIVLSKDLLQIQIQTTVDLTRQTASDNLLRSITAVHQMTQASGLLTGLLTNFITPLPTNGWQSGSYLYSNETRYIQSGSATVCFCQSDKSCPIPGNLYLYKPYETYGLYNLSKLIPNHTLPGLVVDCLPMQMALASSLECFYNQTCLDILISAYSKNINISILDKSLSSRFFLHTTIEQFVNELFIEEITNEITFKIYYDQCNPSYCTYTIAGRFDIIFVITSIIGLIGGLNVALRLISPFLISFILNLKEKKNVPRENLTIKIRLQNIFKKIKLSIIQVNVFNSHSQDIIRTNKERISTRVYIILMISAISILIFYTFLSVQTTSKTIEFPSQNQYEILQNLYPDTLKCPCNDITIPYEDIIEIIPYYHQLCTSDFIQSSWYKQLHALTGYYYPSDFRLSASSYFQMLAVFCELANLTIIHANRRFSSTILINNEILSRNLFVSQTNALINTFLNSIQVEFDYTISMINAILHSNHYLSGTHTNAFLYTLDFRLYGITTTYPLQIIHFSTLFIQEDHTSCTCARNPSCMSQATDGIRTSCFIMDTVLQSSLECWYNETCLKQLQQTFIYAGVNITNNISLLNSTLPSRFPPTTPFQTIVQDILVEQWNTSASYENFYEKCRPIYCKYTYEERSNTVYMINTIIALFGGLNVVLRIISPFLAKIFSKLIKKCQLRCRLAKNNNQQTPNNQADQSNIRQGLFPTQIREKFSKLNLFDSDSTEIDIIHHERSSTRLYLIALFSIIFLYVISNIILKEITSKTILTPTQTQYEQLYSLYSNTLQCPCTDISLSYKKFLTINADFHQICTSDFVSDVWLDYLFGIGFWGFQIKSDIRGRGEAYFSLLSSLCKLSKTTTNNSIDTFLDEIFVSDQIISEKEFLLQINLILNRFKINTPYKFSCALQLLRDITHGNTFISTYILNWEWNVIDNRSNATVSASPVLPDNICSCGKQSDCITPGGIYATSTNKLLFSMLGFNVGCSVVETLFRSTFECLYNQTCIDQLQQYGTDNIEYVPAAKYINAMNLTYSSRFLINTTIIDIVDQLFIEQWKINISYSAFYQQCAPMYCSYTFNEHHDFIYIFTQFLAMYGGLTVALRLIIPYIIKLIFSIKKRCRNNQVTPDI